METLQNIMKSVCFKQNKLADLAFLLFAKSNTVLAAGQVKD